MYFFFLTPESYQHSLKSLRRRRLYSTILKAKSLHHRVLSCGWLQITAGCADSRQSLTGGAGEISLHNCVWPWRGASCGDLKERGTIDTVMARYHPWWVRTSQSSWGYPCSAVTPHPWSVRKCSQPIGSPLVRSSFIFISRMAISTSTPFLSVLWQFRISGLLSSFMSVCL